MAGRTWIFQGNPDVFDLDGYLTAGSEILWSVRQRHFASEIAPGDRVYLWRASGERTKAQAGVVASATVLDAPQVLPDHEASRPYWRSHAGEPPRLRTRLTVERVANQRQVIRRDWLLEDPVLANTRILRFRSETNYLLAADEAARLDALWDATGRAWSETECLAGLWAYRATRGGEVSKTLGSVVATVAVRIGRAVGAVYNKVMNFRHLDPRDDRDGLPGVGAADRVVWDRYYDTTAGDLRTDVLEADFRRLWPDGTALAPPASPLTPPDAAGAARARRAASGQGREQDPGRRRAVELHAQRRAETHYRDHGFVVEDTHETEPFDLRCMKEGREVRVEVKGTTTAGRTVVVTAGEVENARGSGWRTDLFLVTDIAVEGHGDAATATGGTCRLIEAWWPADASLRALEFEYRVPPPAAGEERRA